MEYVLYAVVVLLGFLFRYNLRLTEATRTIGTAISETDSKTGFQDAITPPDSKWTIVGTWLAIVVVFAFTVYEFGWGVAGIALAVFVVVAVIAGAAFVPKPESAHFVRRIYQSMANRYADFQKSGDTVRAEAMKELIDKVEARYGDKLTGSD